MSSEEPNLPPVKSRLVAASDEPPAVTNWIVYVDLDAYYVSCELRDRPDLVGKEVIVGPPPRNGPTRGVVLSASYEARKHGVKSALPAAIAARLAPDAIWIPPDFSKYEHVAHEVRVLLRRFSSEVVPFSIDEAAVILGDVGAEAAGRTAEQIQRALRAELALPASLGVATTRVVAKIATDRAKPGGIVVVPPDRVAEFLAPLPVGVIPGVGPKTDALLADAGVRTIGELATRKPRELGHAVGGFARELIALAQGHPRTHREVDAGPRARSSDRTFPRDVTEWDELAPAVARMAEELGQSLDESAYRYGAVSVAFRWADFTRSQHGGVLPGAAEGPDPLREAALRYARELWERPSGTAPHAVRTLTVRAERLVSRERRQSSLQEFDAGR